MRRSTGQGVLLLILATATDSALASDKYHCTPAVAEDELRRIRRFWTSIALIDAVAMPMPMDDDPDKKSLWRRFCIFCRRPHVASSISASADDPIDADETTFPFSAAGRLAFRDENGIKRWCSAALVDDGSTVITAAHCIRNRNGTAHRDVAFVRAYANGSGELFAIRRMANDRRWVSATTHYRQFDYAILETDTSAGTFLPIVTGDPAGSLSAAGYPTCCGNGKDMQRVTGSAGPVNTTNNTAKMTDNTLDKGASGGPWFSDLGTGEVNGITAAKVSNTVALSPRFGQAILDIIKYVQDGCPDEDNE